MNLKPSTKITTVTAARASDMPIMAIQYNTSNKPAKMKILLDLKSLCVISYGHPDGFTIRQNTAFGKHTGTDDTIMPNY
ncbi:hypothetical protein J31TS3_43620 [Paenibacillus lactis]|nr:hypothetical protein J31TS3_43620 [Paenibacillus lactis]